MAKKVDKEEVLRVLNETNVSVMEMKEAIKIMQESCLFPNPENVEGCEVITAYSHCAMINIESLIKIISDLENYLNEKME